MKPCSQISRNSKLFDLASALIATRLSNTSSQHCVVTKEKGRRQLQREKLRKLRKHKNKTTTENATSKTRVEVSPLRPPSTLMLEERRLYLETPSVARNELVAPSDVSSEPRILPVPSPVLQQLLFPDPLQQPGEPPRAPPPAS